MKRPWRLATILAVSVVSGVLYLGAANDGDAPSAATDRSIRRVRVAPVETIEGHSTLRFSGVTRAARRARVGFSLGGRITARPVDVGDRVAAGDELARLDDREWRHAVDAARATRSEIAAQQAQRVRDRDRVAALVEAKAATREELERAQAGVDALAGAEEAVAARLRDAQRRLADVRLVAPYAGTVTAVHQSRGEYATPGAPVVTLAGDGAVEVEVEVPESVVGHLSDGARVPVELPALGRRIDGQVTAIGRTTVGPGRLFPVVVTLDPPATAEVPAMALAAGLTAEVTLALDAAPTLAVPVAAIVDPSGSHPRVFRVRRDGDDGASVEQVAVMVGTLRGHRVTLRGGLAAGDEVVVVGQHALLDGERVDIAP